MTSVNPSRIGAIILAAGRASRFGRAKQLLELDGESLLDRACRLAGEAGCEPVLRVLGARTDEILARPCAGSVTTLVHADWEQGMGSSLAAGMRRMQETDPSLEAVLVMLCDQPGVEVGLLKELLGACGPGGVSIALSDAGGATGPPAVFGREHFAELAELKGDRGAKVIAGTHPDKVRLVEFPAGSDVDSEEEWERFLKERRPDETASTFEDEIGR